MGVEWLTGFLPSWDWAVRRWRQFRHPARIDIDLTWRLPWLLFDGTSGSRSPRGIAVEVVAGKDEEVVVVEATVEARTDPQGDWTAIMSLDHRFHLPHVVKANRMWSRDIAGGSVADALEEVLDPDGPVELRIRAIGPHGTTLDSDPLTTTVTELRRKANKRR